MQFWVHADVENTTMRKQKKYRSISLNTKKRHISKLTTHVESKISCVLLKSFALVFDGYSTSKSHYVAVFQSSSRTTRNDLTPCVWCLRHLKTKRLKKATNMLNFSYLSLNWGYSFCQRLRKRQSCDRQPHGCLLDRLRVSSLSTSRHENDLWSWLVADQRTLFFG